MNAHLPIETLAAATAAVACGASRPDDVALFDVDTFGLVIVGRGHPTDLACQLVIKNDATGAGWNAWSAATSTVCRVLRARRPSRLFV
jgi:hypothetical protein